jgi:hypothetical protein
MLCITFDDGEEVKGKQIKLLKGALYSRTTKNFGILGYQNQNRVCDAATNHRSSGSTRLDVSVEAARNQVMPVRLKHGMVVISGFEDQFGADFAYSGTYTLLHAQSLKVHPE